MPMVKFIMPMAELRLSSERNIMFIGLSLKVMSAITTVLNFVMASEKSNNCYLSAVMNLYRNLIGQNKEWKWTGKAFNSWLKNPGKKFALMTIIHEKVEGLMAETDLWFRDEDKGDLNVELFNTLSLHMLVFGFVSWLVSLGFDRKDGSWEDSFIHIMCQLLNETELAKDLDEQEPIFRGMMKDLIAILSPSGWDGDDFHPEILTGFFGEREIKILQDTKAMF